MSQTADYTEMCDKGEAMYRTRGDRTGGECYTDTFKIVAQYGQFIDKNLKQVLVICYPRVKYVWQLNEVTNKGYSNMR